MSTLNMLVQVATILSGLVSLVIILGAVIDYLTSGKVRYWTRKWLGMEGLREDHVTTQMFLIDLGDSHNELVDTVCDEHSINQDNRPSNVNTRYYQRLLDDDVDISRGDFTRGD